MEIGEIRLNGAVLNVRTLISGGQQVADGGPLSESLRKWTRVDWRPVTLTKARRKLLEAHSMGKKARALTTCP